MKKILSLSLAYCLIFTLASCGSGISEEQYHQVCAERDALRVQVEELKEKENTVLVDIKGDFTATVHSLVPDYVFDDITPQFAVVTLFQDSPFLLYVGSFGTQLEAGETYVFEIDPVEGVEMTAEEFERASTSKAASYYQLRVSSFRVAEMDDMGLDSDHLVFEKR